MPKQQIGLIGLAVMGKNLAFNIASRGYSLSVYNRTPNKTDKLLSESNFPSIVGIKTIEEFVESLESPRKILMMVKAGEPVDQTIEQLLPYLSEGDLLSTEEILFTKIRSEDKRIWQRKASNLSVLVSLAAKKELFMVPL